MSQPAGSPTPEAQTPQGVAEHGNGQCMGIKAQFAPYKAATAVQSEEHSVLEVSLDDPFMEGEGLSFQKEQAQDVLPRVVMYDHKTRGVYSAHVCLSGEAEKHNSDNVKSDLECLSYKRFLMKSDQEPGIIALKKAAVKDIPSIEPLCKESPVTEHAANGHVEGAIETIANQVRCIQDATEHEYKAKFHSKHMLTTWTIPHAAFVLNRYGVAKDGRKPFECSREKPRNGVLLQLGEGCQHLAVKGSESRRTKLDTQWQRGVFLELASRGKEAIIATPSGIYKTWSIRRRPK